MKLFSIYVFSKLISYYDTSIAIVYSFVLNLIFIVFTKFWQRQIGEYKFNWCINNLNEQVEPLRPEYECFTEEYKKV